MKIIRLICILNFAVFAGEVDQYLAWNRLPNDEIHYLNQFFNSEIQVALGRIHADSWIGCKNLEFIFLNTLY